MAQEIMCEVKSCYFWNEGERCGADRIFVVNSAPTSPSMEVGNIGGASHARTSDETACKTFRPKD